VLSGTSSIYALIASSLTLLVSGFFYDLIGRRIYMISMYLIVVLANVLVVVSGPSTGGFTFARVLIFTGFTVVIANPLINDYVENQDRGKATALK